MKPPKKKVINNKTIHFVKKKLVYFNSILSSYYINPLFNIFLIESVYIIFIFKKYEQKNQTMKNLFIILLAAFFVLGCRDTKKEGDLEMDKVEVIDDQASSEAIDPVGLYTGTLPCVDCPGIEIELSLTEDGNYVLLTERLGQDDPVIEEIGKYRVSDVGNLVMLDGIEDRPNTYYIQENTLILLDLEGNKLATDLEGDYILRKREL